MPMLHYQRVGADTLGTTAATRETIGTITIPSNATNVWAIIAQRGSTATTTADEGCVADFFVQPNSIGLAEFSFASAQPTGGGAATNEAGVYDPGTYVPFRALSTCANEQVTFSYEAPFAMTQEDYGQAFLLTSNGGIDATVLDQRGEGLSALKKWCDWSVTAWDADIYDSTSEVMAETITVPASVGLIHAAMVTVVPTDNLTAGEHFAGYITLTGTIPNLSPMDIPLPLIGASLGTHVDWCPGMKSYIYPMYIPGTGKNETITATVNLAATCTAEFVVGLTLFGTKK